MFTSSRLKIASRSARMRSHIEALSSASTSASAVYNTNVCDASMLHVQIAPLAPEWPGQH
ncbi:hypothetical protein TYRP_005811 [Tyrophagus putrescentiae]|nr:hypothetical protein TYRP_005811 [Tyrophagus putrescentiae]